MFFHLKFPKKWNFSKVKLSSVASSLLNLAETKVLRSRPRTAMFVESLANFKSRALCLDPPRDRLMPHAEVLVRAQASYGNITFLSHLDAEILTDQECFLHISLYAEEEFQRRLFTISKGCHRFCEKCFLIYVAQMSSLGSRPFLFWSSYSCIVLRYLMCLCYRRQCHQNLI